MNNGGHSRCQTKRNKKGKQRHAGNAGHASMLPLLEEALLYYITDSLRGAWLALVRVLDCALGEGLYAYLPLGREGKTVRRTPELPCLGKAVIVKTDIRKMSHAACQTEPLTHRTVGCGQFGIVSNKKCGKWEMRKPKIKPQDG